MKNKYYLSGTILGLCLVHLVAIYLIPPKIVLEMLSKWSFLVPVIIGYIAALAVGALADRFIHRHGIVVTLLVLVAVVHYCASRILSRRFHHRHYS